MASRSRSTPYEDYVFINCPFDDEYRPLFEAVVFAVHDCGFVARCALEVNNATGDRLGKIFRIIGESRLGIHDISRTELDAGSGLPRFNMPLELGMFLGALKFGAGKHRLKSALVLDPDRYRYQRFLSDLAGRDIRSHQDDYREAIKIVRDWLRDNPAGLDKPIPSGADVVRRYHIFRETFPKLCEKTKPRLDPARLIFKDFTTLTAEFLKANPG